MADETEETEVVVAKNVWHAVWLALRVIVRHPSALRHVEVTRR